MVDTLASGIDAERTNEKESECVAAEERKCTPEPSKQRDVILIESLFERQLAWQTGVVTTTTTTNKKNHEHYSGIQTALMYKYIPM